MVIIELKRMMLKYVLDRFSWKRVRVPPEGDVEKDEKNGMKYYGLNETIRIINMMPKWWRDWENGNEKWNEILWCHWDDKNTKLRRHWERAIASVRLRA